MRDRISVYLDGPNREWLNQSMRHHGSPSELINSLIQEQRILRPLLVRTQEALELLAKRATEQEYTNA